MIRVALCTNILTPYRLPVYRALAETPGWRLRLFVDAATEFDRPWETDPDGLDRVRVGGVSRVWRGRTVHLPFGLLGALRRFRPHVVVSGELGARSLAAWLYAALAHVPLVLWSYPTRDALAAMPRWRRALARWLLGQARAVVGMGHEARAALAAQGVEATRVFDARNAHDVEGLAKALASLDSETLEHGLRVGLGCRSRVALVAGRLVAWKGIAELLDAWERVPSGLRRDWSLLVVGSGPLEERVRAAAASHLEGEIVHVPAVAPGDLVGFYAAADLLVFPTLGEPWGLVVNEAFACGLPVLCSTRAGCAADLLQTGEASAPNGWTCDPTDPDAFTRTLAGALACGQRHRFGENASVSVAGFTPAAMADGMRRALERALERSSR